ncbi:MAG: hypothetical protein ACREWE_15120, partial [Gammaproteobacteria bacterium]
STARSVRCRRASPAPRARPRPRALSVPEQHTILEVLHEPAYVDSSPRTVFARLLDAGRRLRAQSHARKGMPYPP